MVILLVVKTVIQANTILRKTFEGENIHEFRGCGAIHESFICDLRGIVYNTCGRYSIDVCFTLVISQKTLTYNTT